MNKDTLEKMAKLRMPGMIKAYKELDELKNKNELTFEQKLTLLIDSEIDSRHNNAIKKLMEKATLSEPGACVEDIKYYDDRHLNRDLIEELANNNYIKNGNKIFIIGATGTGKSYLACALGNCACQNGIKVKYVRLPDLLTDLNLGREQGRYKKVLKDYEKADLLILDEWLLIPASERAQQDILEIMERRYKNKGTIFCSQFDSESWLKRLGGGALAEAIMDRVKTKAIKIFIHGEESMRTREK